MFCVRNQKKEEYENEMVFTYGLHGSYVGRIRSLKYALYLATVVVQYIRCNDVA